ncbi:MAG: hypothetical protein ACLP8S_13890 [Solirubrobacteraceae bacterium]
MIKQSTTAGDPYALLAVTPGTGSISRAISIRTPSFEIFGSQYEAGYLDHYSIVESITDETTLSIKHMLAPSTMTVPSEQLDEEFFAPRRRRSPTFDPAESRRRSAA